MPPKVFQQSLTDGTCSTLADLSALTGQSSTEISRVLPLAFLAADIIRAILKGRRPIDLSALKLKRMKPLPTDWSKQRQKIGVSSLNN